MDIMMPNIDGIEASKIIKTNHPSTMVIALSALDDEDSKYKMLLSGAEDYLTKPIKSNLFAQRIKNYISIIKHRKNLLATSNTLNPFSKDIFNKKIVFNIKEESDLAEFWTETVGEGFLAGHCDTVRITYGLGLWLLKTKNSFKIVVEENESSFFILLLNCGSIKRPILERLLKRHLKDTLYVFTDNSLFLKLPKLDQNLTISVDEESRKILGKSHQGSMCAKEYVSGSIISLLPKIESLENIEEAIDINIFELESGQNNQVMENLISNFQAYHEILGLLTSFNHLAFAIESLIEFLQNIKDDKIEKSKFSQLLKMLLFLLQDLTNWRKQIFIKQEALNIHYLDASLLSSCMQIRSLFDDKNIDEGDDLEFF